MNASLCRGIVVLRAIRFDPALSELGSYFPCEHCGDWHEGLEAHHRKFRSRGGLWTPANIVLLCRRCHEGATAEKWWAQRDGLNVASTLEPTKVPIKVWYVYKMVFLTEDGDWRQTA